MAKGKIAKEREAVKHNQIETVVRLGNERSRYKMALMKTLELLGVTGSDNDWLIDKIRTCEINPVNVEESIIELRKESP